MNTVVTILVTILIFGLLIFIHELGHYIAARIFHVGIKEFAIGMGPKLFSRRGKHNVFSVRALPIGGFVSMVGEYADDREEDLDEADRGKTPLNTIPVWRRIVICLAGPLMNVLLGMLVMSLVVVSTPVLGSTTVAQFVEGSTSDASGLRPGDTILEVAGQKIHVIIELNYVIAVDGIEPVDVLVERDGEEVLLRNVSFPVTDEDGVALANRDFAVYRAEKTAGEVVYQAFWQSVATIELTVDSLVDTFRGRYGISALSGPIGIGEQVGEVIQSTEGAAATLRNLASMMVLISMSLGVFNLLPIPPLDGSKVLFSFLPRKYYGKLLQYERYGFLLLAVLLWIGVLDRPLTFLREGLIRLLWPICSWPVEQLLHFFH